MASPFMVLERDPTPPHPAVPDFLAPVLMYCSNERVMNCNEGDATACCLDAWI